MSPGARTRAGPGPQRRASCAPNPVARGASGGYGGSPREKRCGNGRVNEAGFHAQSAQVTQATSARTAGVRQAALARATARSPSPSASHGHERAPTPTAEARQIAPASTGRCRETPSVRASTASSPAPARYAAGRYDSATQQ